MGDPISTWVTLTFEQTRSVRRDDATARAWLRRCILLGVLLVAFGFLTYDAQAQSPTMDEQNHIARGYAFLRTGNPRLSVEHPPLINLLEALPLGRGVVLPLDDDSWETGDWYRFADLFLWQVNSLPDRMVFLARTPVIALTLLLGALASRWARELGGRMAALAAPALVLLDPNILAHGSLATTDLGITFMVLLAAYVLWHVLKAPTALGVALVGAVTGLMLGSKTSGLVFWGAFGLIFVGDALYSVHGLPRPAGSTRRWPVRFIRRGLLYLAVTLVALVVVWATYGFQSATAVQGGRRLPMGSYWAGILAVFRNVQGGRPSYLLGETRLGGWVTYFPITFGVKTPLPVLLMLPLAALSPATRKRGNIALFLLLPVAVYWLSALSSELDIGYRHLLPTLPLLYVWAAQRFGRLTGIRWRRLGLVLLLWLTAETVWISPHFLSYFNPIAGGPAQGWRVIADSNIDWGQDLKDLSTYLQENPPDVPLYLSWFGSSYPERYGITDYRPLPGLPHYFNMWFEPPTFDEAMPESGLYAISVSNLVEIPLMDKHFFAYFREREPDVRIGYSINLYDVRPEPSP